MENRKSSTSVVLLAAVVVTPFFLKLAGSSIEIGDPVVAAGVGQTLPIGVFAVALFLVGAEMGEGGIAAQQLAGMHAHHAAAKGVVYTVLNLVKSVQQ